MTKIIDNRCLYNQSVISSFSHIVTYHDRFNRQGTTHEHHQAYCIYMYHRKMSSRYKLSCMLYNISPLCCVQHHSKATHSESCLRRQWQTGIKQPLLKFKGRLTVSNLKTVQWSDIYTGIWWGNQEQVCRQRQVMGRGGCLVGRWAMEWQLWKDVRFVLHRYNRLTWNIIRIVSAASLQCSTQCLCPFSHTQSLMFAFQIYCGMPKISIWN